MKESFHYFGQQELLYRLSKGLEKREQEVVFLVGSGLSAPLKPGAPGVLTSDQIVDLIRQEFVDDSVQLSSLDAALEKAKEKRYQAAFLFLQGMLGQTAVNEVVRKAVLSARSNTTTSPFIPANLCAIPEEELRVIDLDASWGLNPGTEALGKLIAWHPNRFGRIVLTTNFDPLVEVAIRKAGGECFKTAVHADGNLSQTEARGCHVAHLHGYWYGSDTLHTIGQLQYPRPHLKASLASLLRNKVIVVCGYGGWDDVFTDALLDVVCDDTASPEILWTLYAANPGLGEHLENRVSAGVNRGRVSLYAGVDCNLLFPQLLEAWGKVDKQTTSPAPATSLVRVKGSLRLELEAARSQDRIIQGDDEDRPPLVSLCVGRESELQRMRESTARVIFVTGIGGQGKSTLAAQYFTDAQQAHAYNHYIWRDCKEESERFENQLASVVEALSGGRISGEDLSKQDIKSIVQLFLALTARTHSLLVFDNTDHYVNLDEMRMTSSADLLIRGLLSSENKSRILLTCRPSVSYRQLDALSCHLEGISLAATTELFARRGSACTEEEIAEAHSLTDGHAFWLDLLAIQVAKQSSLPLREVLAKLRTGTGLLPEKTLTSIWETLSDREKLVLRSMAEAVRPETDAEIADHLHSEMNYKKVVKYLSALKSMNLVVVKRRPSTTDVLELHPLVCQFIRQRFSKRERSSFIDEIIKAYRRYISCHKFQLEEHPTITTLQYWTHTAELDISAGRIASAILTLVEAGEAFLASGYAREFSRVTRILLDSIDWVSSYASYKAFDTLFELQIHTLSQLGEWAEAEALLDKFEMTVVERDARYILYCDLKCYTKWERGEFEDAVKWGNIGAALKKNTQVDTRFDVSHNLALAQRDAGRPELALPAFLEGRKLDEVLDPDELDEEQGGAHYGNVGRCLHFMGQVDAALTCYQKSALLVEKDSRHERVVNQGYIRRWIGELLLARNENRLAGLFLEAARLKWEQVSPPKAAQVAIFQRQLAGQLPDALGMSKEDVETAFLDWITGRANDA